jgi:hypothetical protein
MHPKVQQSIGVMMLAVLVLTARASAQQQRVFQTSEAAFHALVAACEQNDEAAILDILGHEHRDLVVQSDKDLARERRKRFHTLAVENTRFLTQDDGTVTVLVGLRNWPFPIPIKKGADGWRFDTAVGKEEIMNRYIGQNELAVIDFFENFPGFQQLYASEDWDGDRVREYAQHLISSLGTHDGLYWKTAESTSGPLSPLASLVEDVEEDANAFQGEGARILYHGYRFRILTKQGEKAPGGKFDYVINGNMIAGFALLAYPADYGASGIMTFLMNQSGEILQKDLGQDTARAAEEIMEYNPDHTWTEVQRDQ